MDLWCNCHHFGGWNRYRSFPSFFVRNSILFSSIARGSRPRGFNMIRGRSSSPAAWLHCWWELWLVVYGSCSQSKGSEHKPEKTILWEQQVFLLQSNDLEIFLRSNKLLIFWGFISFRTQCVPNNIHKVRNLLLLYK